MNHPSSSAGQPARILIVRLSALGDLVFCTSLLEGLRRRYPAAHIAWLAQSGFAGLLEHDPRIDAVIGVPKDSLSSPRALLNLRRRLRAGRYDWVIDAQGLAKSRGLAWLAGGSRRIGFASKEPLAFLMHEIVAKGGNPADIASEYRALAQHLTGSEPGAPRLPVQPESAEVVAQAVRDGTLPPRYVALCPFTTRPQKHWVDDYWPALAERLCADGQRRCVIFGGPGDRAHADALLAAMPAGCVNLTGRTALRDLPAWIARADALVGVDTGLTHIGIATGRPTVALFGSTCPYTGGADSPLSVLYDDLPCAPCKRRPTCDGAFTCMRQLTPERAAAALRQLLDGASA
ncbi:MAG: glycosyltransferase family 9 protein [Nevskiales bacterium]|nr:glycosyltransferase family 9 protein [Nevskiales bacterium]